MKCLGIDIYIWAACLVILSEILLMCRCTLALIASFGCILHFMNKKFGLQFLIRNEFDEKSEHHGGEIVADVLKAHNVDFLFTLAGGHISPILVAAEKCGIKVIDTRHEVNAVFAADAVARLTGTVGVVAVTAGPGLTNTVTAVKNAQMAESPLLVMGGAAAGLLKGRGALQDIDQLSLFKSICKHSVSISKVRDIAPMLRKALCVAKSDTPGPVFVEFPIDVLYPFALVKREMGINENSKTIQQTITKWYMKSYLHNLFANANAKFDVSPMPVNYPKATELQVQSSLELLKSSKRPIIIVGSQATLPPVSADKVGEYLKKLGVPCFLGGMSRGILGRNDPNQFRHCRKQALKEADLIILAGAVCDFRLSYGRSLNSKSKIISVNRSKEQVSKNSDAFWKPTLAIQADVGSFIKDLACSMNNYECDQSWFESLRKLDDEKEEKTRLMAEEKTEQHLNPLKILQELENSLGDNTILVADGGDFVASAAYIMKPRGPLCWLDPGAFGTLGVGGGFALGAKLCRPDMEVVIVYGDGSAGYSIMEYDTFRRFKLPILSIIGNDACWTQIVREQLALFNSSVACQLEYTDYHLVAEALGAKGFLLNDVEKIKDVFTKGRAEIGNGKSVLINALVGKTAFREGSISI